MIDYDMSEADYHGDRTRDSHSAIEIFLRRRSDYAKWRAGTLKRRATDELEFGGYFHALVFEGVAAVRERYIVAPSRLDIGQAKPEDDDAHVVVNRQRKEGRQAWEACEAEAHAHGKRIVMPQDAQRAAAMLDALRLHGEAGPLLFGDDGRNEVTLRFGGPTGRPSRCRIDRLIASRLLAPDLKTYKPDTDSRRPDPERLLHQAYRFGYHRQAAWYIHALREETGEAFTMPFVFVSNEDEPKVFVWMARPDGVAVAVGEHENRAALLAIEECERSGEWRQPFELEIGTDFQIPNYAVQAAIGNLDMSEVGEA